MVVAVVFVAVVVGIVCVVIVVQMLLRSTAVVIFRSWP